MKQHYGNIPPREAAEAMKNSTAWFRINHPKMCFRMNSNVLRVSSNSF